MMSLFRRYLIAGMILVASWYGAAQASTLVADLDLDKVAITTDFNGESLLLFGAVSAGTTSDIIVIFKGPDVTLASRKKEQVSGIWIETADHYLAGCA